MANSKRGPGIALITICSLVIKGFNQNEKMQRFENESCPTNLHINKLEANLSQTARVEEWAELMELIITQHIRQGVYSNFEIARLHGIPDEIALNNFINYHIGCSPSEIRKISGEQLAEKLEKFGSKIR